MAEFDGAEGRKIVIIFEFLSCLQCFLVAQDQIMEPKSLYWPSVKYFFAEMTEMQMHWKEHTAEGQPS